jgi:hypothetical protein
MTRGISGEGDEDAEADVRRVLEKWRMLDEEEAEEAEREVKIVEKKAREEYASNKE